MRLLKPFILLFLSLLAAGAQTISGGVTFGSGLTFTVAPAAAGINFDFVIEPGYNSTTAYGSFLSSNQAAASTILSGGLPYLTLWTAGTEIPPGSGFTNITVQNANCPATSPFGNITVGGVPVTWPGSNAWRLETTAATAYLDLAFPSPSLVTEVTLYTIVTFPTATNGYGYDIAYVGGGNGKNAYGTYAEGTMVPAFRTENYDSIDSSPVNLIQNNPTVVVWDFTQTGAQTASVSSWDYTQAVLAGPQSVTVSAASGGWNDVAMLMQNTEGYSGPKMYFDFAFFGGITNAVARYGSIPLPTIGAAPTAFPLFNAFTIYTPANYTTGFVGVAFSSDTNISLTSLSRWILSGNSQQHLVYIEDSTGTEISHVTLTSAAVSAAPANQLLNVSLGSPVSITAGTTYYIMSSEINGGDYWIGPNTSVYANAHITVLGAVYQFTIGTAPTFNTHNVNMNGPVGAMFTRP